MRMTSYAPRMATILTLLVLVLVPVATVIGLFVPGLYRDTAWMIPQARGQDLVTLVVAEPLLLAAVIGARRSRGAASPLWLGTLGYLLYTYAMYSYTAYFNALFLVYVALFSASLFALIALVVHLDPAQVRASIRPGMPRRIIASFLALVGVFFLVAWLGQIVPALVQGTVPAVVTLAKTPTSAVHVQDLAVVIPLLFAAAVWVWQRRARGFALAGALLVLADIMLLALPAMSLFSAQAQIAGALDMFWVFAGLAVVSLGVTGLFLAHLGRPTALASENPSPDTAEATVPDAAVPLPVQAREVPPEPHAVAGR